ncbi:MAG: bacillithiol biosynthesis cysteine-adding enzyme BshC [Flavobacteriales bacterium]|nr:bacillithiol biosynthesis cysteine-adding enzyme BshC [Flavobacteriales bacterium]
MEVKRIAYADTGRFTAPVLDHLADVAFIRQFLELPADLNGLRIAAEKRTFNDEHRNVLCAALEKQHAAGPVHEAVRASLIKLRDPRCLTVTTGHQLCLFSGPLYVPYKILNTIRLARQAGTELDRPVVPIFWMASEDHDAAEIDHAVINGRTVRWSGASGGAVGRMKLTGIGTQVEEAIEALGAGADAATMSTMLREAYQEGRTLAEATRHFFHALFGRFGLVIIDGDDASLKKLFAPVIEEELLNQVAQRTVAYANGLIEERYPVQAHARAINLFHLRPGHRSRIVQDGDHYQVLDGGPRWTLDEMLLEARIRPQDFSPNVLLRPVYQELVLPNIAYIGGGGELAYWIQLRWSFQALRVPMPVLFLRTSAATISSKHMRQWSDLRLSPQQLFAPADALKAEVARKGVGFRTELAAEAEELENLYARIMDAATQADASLEGSVEARRKQALHGLERLQKGMVRAAKQDQAVWMRRMETIGEALFPAGGLQERRDSMLPRLAAEGLVALDTWLDLLDPLDRTFALVVED